MWRHFLVELGKVATVIRFDERGHGLSDRGVTDHSLEARVADLEAVADHAGRDRFALMAMAQGGPVSVAYAARHPERLTRLILYGSYAGALVNATPEEIAMDEAFQALIKVGWRRRGDAVRRRRVGRRHVLRRRDVRPAPPGGRRRAGADRPPGRHDRPGLLDARGIHRADVRDHEALRARSPARRAAAAAVGPRRPRARPLRRPGDRLRDFFKATYGPTIAAYRGLADDPERAASLDRELADLGDRYLEGGVMEWEYLLVTARRA